MIDSIPMPCSDWLQKLASKHQDDLPPADRRALDSHLASCPACHEVYAVYMKLGTRMRSLTSDKPVPEFSFELRQTKQKPSQDQPVQPLQSLFGAVRGALSALHLRVGWSPLYQKIHTSMLFALTSFPRRIAYVHTGNRFLYAIRTDSGYFLWRLKRYRRGELLSSLPMRWSGMLFIGSGVALVAAMDFCERAVQA